MDKNFKVRVSVGIGLFAVAILALYTFSGIPFKILYGIFSFVAGVELVSFLNKKRTSFNFILVMLEIIFLIGGILFVTMTDIYHFWYIILGVCGYDIFAYLFGKMCGGKIFKKSRPFPYVSKNKTWEGTFLGLLSSASLVAALMAANNAFDADWVYLFCGPLALIGDLFESFLKRQFKVKDSNEIVIKNHFFSKIEKLIGGSEGHGGYLDRIDSTAFTATILFLIIWFIK